jgi:arylsulfatase A-like enzyme
VSGLAVHGGMLTGRTTTTIPIVDFRRPRSDDRDVLHEVHVRMRASAGANLWVNLRPTEEVDLAWEAANAPIIPWVLTSPIVAGSEMRTYVLRTTWPTPMASRHLLVRPTDAAGATFEIESVRMVSRKEHLAGIRSGMGWQGLGEVYRETLVSRAPDTLRFDVRIPSRPRMQVSVGTLESGPVTFKVSVEQGSSVEVVAAHTVTTPHRWETMSVDLARFAGRGVALSLALSAETPGALGFWGSPVIHEAVTPPTGRADEPPQGVIFIWADTLRRDHLPSYGYSRPTAPAIARLAAEGTIFDDSVAQASWTKASGPSMMTSLYPTSTGVQSFGDILPSSAHTLAEAFRREGRATMALTSIPFVGKFSSMHQGFEELHESGALDRGGGALRLKTARLAVDRLLPWLEEHRDVPFYVLLHVTDPHSPMKPEPPYDTLFADPAGRAEHERRMETVKPRIRNASMRPRIMPTRDELVEAGIDPAAYIAYEKAWYDGSIRAMDAEIGRLLERLRELDLDRRTLIVFTSDHGEEFLEHGRTFHQQSVYGELANVPLVFRWPGRVPAGRRVPEMVQQIDIMPTLLELSGTPAPQGMQGASLVPFLRGERNPAWPRPAVTEASGRLSPTEEEHDESFAIAVEGWKLVHHTKRPAGRPEFELFDRKQDPLDQDDLAAKHPDIVERLKKEMQAWRKRAESMRLKSDAQLAGSLSPEELERLRALGYVQ